ncbi:glycogen/starch/alpha-glucan family phosphorylase, partial [Cyanobium sp. AMD-g]|uniref:glycogen/starch/alpha-glucan family phosphorylase n=1 Tax=Cyanobium sp. AMD-g TaxID=2823699 RepID=UPI0020CEBBFE
MGLPEPGTYLDPQRNGLRMNDLLDGLIGHLFYSLGRRVQKADHHDLYLALSYAIRDRLMTRYLAGLEAIDAHPRRIVAYLSAEFLIGPQLGNNLLMLGMQRQAAEALRPFGINDIEEILDVEEEPGLGNGGLGRLAACFLESLASLEIPATGYGIRYEFGIFDQLIRDGWQVEITDKWLKGGWPWEIAQPEKACVVGFGGHTESYRDRNGAYRVRWIPAEHTMGVPHDVPVLGYRVNTCNRLRLWRAEACESFDFQTFNSGDYYGAVDMKVGSETLSKVLYPSDGTAKGRQLRLKQQHFFVSCSLQDMIRSLDARGIPIEEFPAHWAVQLNDTHPSIAVAEMMRLLLDDKHLEWDAAWAITTACLSYTNHTLLPEALEKWGLDLFGSLLPRHLELIFEINRRFLQQVRLKYPGNDAVLQRLSIIDEASGKAVRMAHLATVGSHHVNGVAALHSALVKQDLFPEFAALWPEKFTNVTNGVTPRRWVALANPSLHALLCETIGADWLAQPQSLRHLEAFQRDGAFLARWAQCKRTAKQRLAGYIQRELELAVDPDSLFDVQVKRIHEYKRQHLNALQVIAQYLRIKNGLADGMAPRTVI